MHTTVALHAKCLRFRRLELQNACMSNKTLVFFHYLLKNFDCAQINQIILNPFIETLLKSWDNATSLLCTLPLIPCTHSAIPCFPQRGIVSTRGNNLSRFSSAGLRRCSDSWHATSWEKSDISSVQLHCTSFCIPSECHKWSAALNSVCLLRWPSGCFRSECYNDSTAHE